MHRRHLLIALALWLVGSQATITPAPVPVKRPPEKQLPEHLPMPIPKLAGLCNWGLITQNGREITITSDTWQATGEIQPDNSLHVYWTCDGTHAIGVYRMAENGIMRGHYGYPDSAEILPNGVLFGDINPEDIAPAPAPPAQGADS